MATIRQSQQTYALTLVTDHRRRLLQTTRNADLVIATLFRHRDANRFQLHGFVVMPDHLHVRITPAMDHATSRCVQLVKGGASHAIGKPVLGKLWQDGYHEDRVRDAADYTNQLLYIANNPTRKSLDAHPFVHTHPLFAKRLDPSPF